VTSIADIQQAVVAYYGVTIDDLRGSSQAFRFARPRQVAMYLAREMTGREKTVIGRAFGDRHHSTVIHAVKVIGAAMLDPSTLHDINAVRDMIASGIMPVQAPKSAPIIQPAPEPGAPEVPRVAPAQPVRKIVGPAARVFVPLDRPARDVSRSGRAADHLRKFCHVFRCDAVGNPLPDGFYWCRGRAVLTDAELIERAVSLGWQEDAWKQVA
jgi:hypothetical protein